MNESLQKIEPQTNMLALIDRAARDPAVDVAKMVALTDLAERIHNREAKAAYDAAMNAAQGEMRPISRDCHNPQTRSKYASYEAIDMAIRPIYTAHGFGMSFGSRAGTSPDRVIVTCRVSHRAGHTEPIELEMPADGKGAKGNDVMTKTHATGSALSYAKRYIANLVWNLSFGEADDDGNAASPRKTAPAQTGKTAAEWSQPDHHNKSLDAVLKPPAKAADVLRKQPTEATWKWAKDELLKEFPEQDILRFLRVASFQEWSLDNVPASHKELAKMKDEIAVSIAGPPPENSDDELPPEIASVVFHIPPKGVKMTGYKPQTLGEMWLNRHDKETASRLFGYIDHFKTDGWTKRNQDGTEIKMPPSAQDIALRQGLDALAELVKQRAIAKAKGETNAD